MNLEKDKDMIISDIEALKIHSFTYENESYSTDDSDSGKSSLDEEYFRNKPGPLQIDRKLVVTIKSLVQNEQSQIQDNISINTYQREKYKASTSQYSDPIPSKVITNTSNKNYGYSTDVSSWMDILDDFKIKHQALELDRNKIVTIKSLYNTQSDFSEDKKIKQSHVATHVRNKPRPTKVPCITDFSSQTSPRNNTSQGIEKEGVNNTKRSSQINSLDQFVTNDICQSIREVPGSVGPNPYLKNVQNLVQIQKPMILEANLSQNVTCSAYPINSNVNELPSNPFNNKRISNNRNLYNWPTNRGFETPSTSQISNQITATKNVAMNRQNLAKVQDNWAHPTIDRNRNHRTDIFEPSRSTSPRNVSQGIEKERTPSKLQVNNTKRSSQINSLDQFLTSDICQNIREVPCSVGPNPYLKNVQNLVQIQKHLILEANLSQNITCSAYPINSNVNELPSNAFNNKRISNNRNVHNWLTNRGLETPSISQNSNQLTETKNVAMNRQNPAKVRDSWAHRTNQITDTKNVATNRQNPAMVRDNLAHRKSDGNRNHRAVTVEPSRSTQSSLIFNASNLPAVVNKDMAHQRRDNNNQAAKKNYSQVQPRSNTNQTATRYVFPIVQRDAPVRERNPLLGNTGIGNESLNVHSDSMWCCCPGFMNFICCRYS